MKFISVLTLGLWLLAGCSRNADIARRSSVQTILDAHSRFKALCRQRVKHPADFLYKIDASKCPDDFRGAWNNYLYLQKKVGGDTLSALASIPVTHNIGKFHDAEWESRDAWQRCLNIASKYGAFEVH